MRIIGVIVGSAAASCAGLAAVLLWPGLSAAQTVPGLSPIGVPASGGLQTSAAVGTPASVSQSVAAPDGGPAAMPNNRVLVLRRWLDPSDPCPPLKGWRGEVVLTSQSGTYCGYQWVDAGTPQLAFLNDFGTVSVDQPVIGGHSLELVQGRELLATMPTATELKLKTVTTFPALEPGQVPTSAETEFTLHQYGWQKDLPAAPSSVTVVVLDTAPQDSAFDTDTNTHGRRVGLLIRDLACGGPERRFQPCGVDVRYELALPLEMQKGVEKANLTHGGNFGTHGDLARAIGNALDGWDPVDHGPLVLNLSLGWFTSALDHTLITPQERVLVQQYPHVNSMGELSVYQALEQAYCAGARIVVATGNRANGRPEPTLPGGWATLDAPSCREQPPPRGGLTPDPLSWMVPVSAVDESSVPLGTTPELGYAPLNAYGLAVTIGDTSPSDYFGKVLPARSGSSFGTAGVTAVLASALSHQPFLASESAAVVLMKGALPAQDPPSMSMAAFLTRQAKGSLDTKHFRVSLCETLRALGAHSGVCAPFPKRPASDVREPATVDDTEVKGPGARALDEASAMEAPWIYPQPEGRPPCKACRHMTFSSDHNYGQLIVELDPTVTSTLEVTRIQLELDGVWLYEIPKIWGKFPNSFTTLLAQPGGKPQQALLKQTVHLSGANYVVEEALTTE